MAIKDQFSEEEIIEMMMICELALSDPVGIHSQGCSQEEEPLYKKIREIGPSCGIKSWW